MPDKLPPRVVPAPPREDSKQLITGKRAGDAFQAIVDADRRYVWQDRHSVIQFYPVNQFNDPGAPLNRTIKEFVVEHGTLQDALTAVRRLFNPAFQPSGVMQSGFSLSEAAEAEGKEVFSVNVHNATLRDVLNAIVTAHGAAMWFVAYRDSPATLQNMTLELRTFGGWALATGF